MYRRIRFGLFSGLSVWIVLRIADEVEYRIDYGSLILGLLIAAITGFLEFMIGQWWADATDHYKPQVIKFETKETPFQVTWEAIQKRLWGAFVVVVIAGLGMSQRPEFDRLSLEYWAILLFLITAAVFFAPFVFGKSHGKQKKREPKSS